MNIKYAEDIKEIQKRLDRIEKQIQKINDRLNEIEKSAYSCTNSSDDKEVQKKRG